MIYLSASSIKDFISCERKYWYRRFASDKRATSVAADTGTVVHKIIEKDWNNKKRGLAKLEKFPDDYDYIKALHSLENFYKKFQHLLNKNDLIEKKFNVKYARGVKLVGMMDRVTSNGIIYDWKTNKRLPLDLSNDPQFIIYHYAYSKLHKRPPSGVYFASLSHGRLIKFKYNKVKEDILLNEIIPDMLENIKKENFNPTGLYRFSTCRNCFFKEHCHQWLGLEDNNELDRTQFNFR
jgi:RecB family exonuclease